ncbi:MAG: EF-hand domain-containing protein [Hyphomicrobiales bacterium]
MKKISLMAMTLAGLTGFSAMALSAEPYFPRAQRSFDRVDANHDGKIEKGEFLPLASKRLARMDVNGDKAVSAAELQQRMEEALIKRRDRIMALMDANHDGSISESELDKLVEAMFNGADSDKDGGVTMAELKGFKTGQWRKSYLGQTQPGSTGN